MSAWTDTVAKHRAIVYNEKGRKEIWQAEKCTTTWPGEHRPVRQQFWESESFLEQKQKIDNALFTLLKL